jgi:hypothetical protein
VLLSQAADTKKRASKTIREKDLEAAGYDVQSCKSAAKRSAERVMQGSDPWSYDWRTQLVDVITPLIHDELQWPDADLCEGAILPCYVSCLPRTLCRVSLTPVHWQIKQSLQNLRSDMMKAACLHVDRVMQSTLPPGVDVTLLMAMTEQDRNALLAPPRAELAADLLVDSRFVYGSVKPGKTPVSHSPTMLT